MQRRVGKLRLIERAQVMAVANAQAVLASPCALNSCMCEQWKMLARRRRIELAQVITVANAEAVLASPCALNPLTCEQLHMPRPWWQAQAHGARIVRTVAYAEAVLASPCALNSLMCEQWQLLGRLRCIERAQVITVAHAEVVLASPCALNPLTCDQLQLLMSRGQAQDIHHLRVEPGPSTSEETSEAWPDKQHFA